jgi:hypothetical protein
VNLTFSDAAEDATVGIPTDNEPAGVDLGDYKAVALGFKTLWYTLTSTTTTPAFSIGDGRASITLTFAEDLPTGALVSATVKDDADNEVKLAGTVLGTVLGKVMTLAPTGIDGNVWAANTSYSFDLSSSGDAIALRASDGKALFELLDESIKVNLVVSSGIEENIEFTTKPYSVTSNVGAYTSGNGSFPATSTAPSSTTGKNPVTLTFTETLPALAAVTTSVNTVDFSYSSPDVTTGITLSTNGKVLSFIPSDSATWTAGGEYTFPNEIELTLADGTSTITIELKSSEDGYNAAVTSGLTTTGANAFKFKVAP